MMISIELQNERVLRGQPIHGRFNITSSSLRTIKEVKAMIILREKYMSKLSSIRESRYTYKILFEERNVQIPLNGKYVDFKYTIPENAPYSFDEMPIKTEWQVRVSVKKSRFLSENVSEVFTVLPHILKSPSFPSFENVPIPVQKPHPTEFSSAFIQLWRLLGPFSLSNSLNIELEKREYSPGDTVAGDICFLKDFKDATLNLYLVFVKKTKALWKPAENEHPLLCKKDTFSSGSRFHFSFSLPHEMYPDLETEHAIISWKLRGIIKKPFHVAEIAEYDLRIRPLEY